MLRSFGITSSANSVMFFTVIQCGMVPRCRKQLMRLDCASSDQALIDSATMSGVPQQTKNCEVRPSQVKSPCRLGPEMRFLNSSGVT